MADKFSGGKVTRDPATGRFVPDNIFSRIARSYPAPISPKNLIDAQKWFRQKALEVKQVQRTPLLSGKNKNFVRSINTESIGSMYLYNYDPKWKEKLPYYDLFPLIFVLEVYNDGWLGLNLHYLPPYYRAKLMDALYTVTLVSSNEKMKLAANYSVLKGASKFKFFKPCIKRYLTGHVRSRILFIEPEQWDTALMLPLQKFVKASEETVWKRSKGYF